HIFRTNAHVCWRSSCNRGKCIVQSTINPAAASIEDGGTLAYTLHINSAGPSAAADNVGVQLTVPPGATITWDRLNSDGVCTFAAPVLSCNGIDLRAASTQTPRVPGSPRW